MNNAFSKIIDQKLAEDQIGTVTTKLTIDDGIKEHDVFFQLGFYHGWPVWTEITLSRTCGKDKLGSGVHDDIYGKMIESSRSLMEIVCHHATTVLQARRTTLEELADLWIATRFEPSGKCKALEDELGEGKVLSPFDAVAKIIRKEKKAWEGKMSYEPSEEEIEGMLAGCLEVLEERPDSFTGFERTFLEDIEQKNEIHHLTPGQISKLEEIYEERVFGR